MDIQWPLNPAIGDEVTVGSRTWEWSGAAWRVSRSVSASAAVVSETPPMSPVDGTLWFDPYERVLRVWHGGWAAVSGGTDGSGWPLANPLVLGDQPVPAGLSGPYVGGLDVGARADHRHQLTYVHYLSDVGDLIETGSMVDIQFTPLEAVEYAVPISVHSHTTIDRIMVSIHDNGSAGASLRFGVRAFNNAFEARPGQLVADLGSISATSGASSVVGLACDFELHPGIHWVSVTAQGAAAVRPTLEVGMNPWVRAAGPSGVAGRYFAGAMMAAVTGPLPDLFTLNDRSLDAQTPWIALRRGA